jgi:peptidoglycan hydrolase-like protein with peptidoglycan-binding domain
MPNPGQPTIRQSATGDAVRRLQRALFRTADHEIHIDGIFGWQTEEAVVDFQKSEALTPDGVVGPHTWRALPGGGPMPQLAEGATGDVVRRLQTVLTDGAPGEWGVTPQGVDGDLGPHTDASVRAFQAWGQVGVDGIVGDQTWTVLMNAAGATLESVVGLNFVIG